MQQNKMFFIGLVATLTTSSNPQPLLAQKFNIAKKGIYETPKSKNNVTFKIQIKFSFTHGTKVRWYLQTLR